MTPKARMIATFEHWEPDRVPLYDGVDQDVQSAFLGRPVTTLADEIEFRVKAGYDFVRILCGLRTLVSGVYGPSPSKRRIAAKYSLYTDALQERIWEEEGTGVITSLADDEAYPWPKAEDPDYTLLQGTPQEVKRRIKQLAPGGGYCVSSTNSITEYVLLANFNTMREAVFKYGKYPINL